LEPIKDNEEAVRAYGIHLGTEMCKKILAHGIKTLHLYTLNMEKSALGILAVGEIIHSSTWLISSGYYSILIPFIGKSSMAESWLDRYDKD
jgi:hypothetical protein